MANEKISAMTSATSVNDADVVPIVQGGVNKKSAWSLFKSTLKTYFDTLYQAILTASNMHTFIDALNAMTSPADADRILIVDNSASLAKKITRTNIKASLKTYFDTIYQTIPVEVTGNITAANNTNYIQTASATYTDPTPAQAKGYIIFVRNGTATVGGTAYAIQGTLIYRYYHSGTWLTNTFHNDYITFSCTAAGTNLADSTTYYFSDTPTLALGATATSRKLKVPAPCVLVAARIETIVAGTLAAGDESTTISIRINNTTDSTLSAAVKYTAAAQTLMITGLNVAVGTADDFQLKVVTPNFATNPTTCLTACTLFFQQV